LETILKKRGVSIAASAIAGALRAAPSRRFSGRSRGAMAAGALRVQACGRPSAWSSWSWTGWLTPAHLRDRADRKPAFREDRFHRRSARSPASPRATSATTTRKSLGRSGMAVGARGLVVL